MPSERLKAQVKETIANASGHEQARALIAKGNLAVINSILTGQGRLKDIILFCLQADSLASEDLVILLLLMLSVC